MSNKNHKSNKLRHTICCLYIHGIINAEIHSLKYCITLFILDLRADDEVDVECIPL